MNIELLKKHERTQNSFCLDYSCQLFGFVATDGDGKNLDCLLLSAIFSKADIQNLSPNVLEVL